MTDHFDYAALGLKRAGWQIEWQRYGHGKKAYAWQAVPSNRTYTTRVAAEAERNRQQRANGGRPSHGDPKFRIIILYKRIKP